MDLDLHYRDFVVDDREFIFDYTPGSVPSFHGRDGSTYCAVAAFQHPDPDLAWDPLSTNRQMLNVMDKAMFGTLVMAGQTPDHVTVLIPDTVSPTVDADGPVDLQHVVGLSLGPATNLSWSLPPADLVMRALSGKDSRTGPAGLLGRVDSYFTEMAQRE